MKFGRLQMRILSAVFAAVFIFTATLPVYASGETTDEVTMDNLDQLIQSYASQIKENTTDFYNQYSVACNGIDTLWDTFIATWKVSKATAYYGLSTSKLYAGLLKDFVGWLRDEYFYGYFDNGGKQYNYIAPTALNSSHKKPSSHSNSSHSSGVNISIEESDQFTTNFPIDWSVFGSSNPHDYYWVNNKYDFWQLNFPSWTYTYGDGSTCDTVIRHKNKIFNNNVPSFCYSGSGQNSNYNPVTYYVWRDPDSYSGDIIGFWDLSSGNSSISYYGYHVEGNKIYFDNVGQCNGGWMYLSVKVTDDGRNALYAARANDDNWYYYPTISGKYYRNDLPKTVAGNKYYNFMYGNWIVRCGSKYVIFYNGNFYYLENYNGFTSSNRINDYIPFYDTNELLDMTIIDQEINNYYTIINTADNTTNDLQVLIDLINQYLLDRQNDVDYTDALNDLQEQLLEIQNELNNLSGIATILSSIKKTVKKIDTNVTSIFNRFDSLFTSTGAFALADQLDRLFHHLEATINALPIPTSSSSSPSGDVNFNFGDLDLHLEATLNNFFTMNEEQKNEIAADVQTLKAPFNWVGDVTKNMKSLAGKMVARSAAYAGVGYTSSAYTQEQDPFNTLSFTVSQNSNTGNSSGSMTSGNDHSDVTEENNEEEITVQEEAAAGNSVNENSVNGGGLEAPKIMIHFGNATSEINYGGDAVALDFSWYAPYKPYVDKFIVAFCWAVFLWHLVRTIPGIIGGVDGYVSDISGTITAENIDRRHAKTDAAYTKIGRFHRFRGR